MKTCPYTGILIIAGLASFPGLLRAEEKPSSVLSSLSATTLSGYVDTSAQWNIGTGNANVPNYAFGGPSKADGFNLNVVKLSLEKPIVAEESWGAGYKVDLLFGPDANMLPTQSTGIAADFGVKQAYVALHAPVGNGINFKLGVWDTIIGYEVFDSISNPNFTRSYGYTIEPTTHTGLQAAYQLCESLSAIVGVADTCASTINGRAFLNGGTSLPPGTSEGPKAESYKSYLGALSFTAPTNWGVLSGSTLYGCVINGFHSASVAGPADQTSWYIGGTFNTPINGLKLGAAYDYAGVSEQPLTSHKSAYANAVALYASYQFTEKLAFLVRGEYASSGMPSVFLARKVFETTGTLQYDLWKNVLSRLEFRWDHAADGSNAFGGTVAGAGTKQNSYILLANLAYKF
jgi:Putative beta-barrel porin-2, OmpL-like. bbp2